MTQLPEPAFDRLAAMFRGPDVGGTRYEVVSILGRGGMGVVYLARDAALDREVALKIVDRPSDTDGMAARLAQEARILARLEHPGIVPVHDFGELPDGRWFYAMKRVRGERLDRWIAAGPDRTARLGVFLRICDAVAFAHAHGIVHRDLKPENVMVAEFGEVLVLDWGVASLVEPNAAFITNPVPMAASIVGTPEYMAPEQASGAADVDHRADVYALGVMLDAIGAGTPALAAIAAKASSFGPDASYQTVAALAADVSRFLAGDAVGAHRERLLDRLARFGRRYRLPILLVFAYLIVRILLLWLAKI
ncbi:MAG TPA: serine/threonine-protein kinase [Vicinamibacterales bacterium]